MRSAYRAVAVSAIVAAASLVIRADVTPPSQAAEVQLQLGDILFSEGKFLDSLDAYRNALKVAPADNVRRPRMGVIASALRVAEFDLARAEAEKLFTSDPKGPEAMTLYGDALWSMGLFQEAEQKYKDALAIAPELARGHHGMAKALAARSRLDEAMNEAQAALRLSPRDLEIHHTVGTIYERLHKYEEAAGAYSNYVNLLPNKDRSEKADWSRAEIRFLRSFGQRVPFESDPGSDDKLYTVDFRLVNEKVVVRAKVNDASAQDFVVDTGSENTVITRPTAQRLGITPVTYTLSAGVGRVGLRGLQLARIDSLELGSLKLRNVPCLIKNPPLRDIPVKETEGLSPLALGYSMVIDYKTHKLTFGKHLPEEPKDFELPLRLHRLATVRGTVDGNHQANFVVDTGGEVISISSATATSLRKPETGRRIALKVYGTSGWDPDAFLMPGVDSAVRHDQLQELPGRGAEPERPERAPRLPARRDRRPQVPEPLPRRHRPRTFGASPEERFVKSEVRSLKSGTVRLERCEPSDLSSAFFGRRSRRRCASSQTRRSSSVSTSSGGTRTLAPSRSIATKVRNARARHLARAGQRFLREHIHLHFERRRERAGHARLQDDQVADLDRVEELEVVDGRRHQQRAGVAMAGDGAGDVDQVHDGAAEDEPERVRVVGEHDLHHFGGGVGSALRREIHAGSILLRHATRLKAPRPR